MGCEISRQKQIPCGDDRKKSNGKSKKQIPCGDDNKKGKNKGRAVARRSYLTL
jgi:hypothetical protein